jgi:purine-binding chemotaxis protein CheW
MISTYLSFIICNEYYAVNVDKVLEVLEKQEITPVPNTPDVIDGIINFRGEIVPVFETRMKFNLPRREQDISYVIIVLDLSQNNEVYRVGAKVDKVKDVVEIDHEQIKPVPAMSSEFNAEFVNGVVRLDDKFIMLLDIEKVFSGSSAIIKKEKVLE